MNCVESLELSDDEAMMKRKRNGTEYDRRIDQSRRLPAPICIFNPKKERKKWRKEGIVDSSTQRSTGIVKSLAGLEMS